jgi:hypothetical protein
VNQFEKDVSELGWRAAVALWLENRTTAPKIFAWISPERRGQ